MAPHERAKFSGMPIIENLKEIVEFAKKLNDAQVLKATAELEHECATMGFEMADLLRKLTAAQKEIDDLKAAAEMRSALTFEDNVYWSNVDGERRGPFCPACFHKSKEAVPLQHEVRTYSNDQYHCPLCAHVIADAHSSPNQELPTRAIFEY